MQITRFGYVGTLVLIAVACVTDTGADDYGLTSLTGISTSPGDSGPESTSDSDTETSGDTGSECSPQPPECAELIACLAIALPEADVSDYQKMGSCWCGTAEAAATCLQFCVDQLELAAQQWPNIEECGGDGPSTTGDGDSGDGDGDGDEDPPEVVGASVSWSSNVGVIPNDLAFSPDDTLLASAGWDAFDGDFAIWSVAQGSPVFGPVATAAVNPAVTWSPTGDRVASSGLVDGFRIYTAQGQTVADLSDCQALEITALDWHPSQDLVLAGGSSAQFFSSPKICIRNVANNQDVAWWSLPNTSAIEGAVWSNSGARFATLADCTITVFDTAMQSVINTIQLDPLFCEYAQRLAWRPGTQEIAAIVRIDQDYVVAIVGATEQFPVYLDAEATHLAYSPDGSKLALIGRTGTVWIVDADALNVQHQFAAHAGLTLAVAWSNDGTMLATGGESPRLRVWDLQYGL